MNIYSVKDNLEFYDGIKWCKAKFIGIKEENLYQLEELNTGNSFNLELEQIRFAIACTNEQSTATEYEIEKNSFIICNIINKIGIFYVITYSFNKNQVTKIVREGELRYVKFLPFASARLYDNLIFDLPIQLKNWAHTENFKDLINRIKKETTLNDTQSISIEFCIFEKNEKFLLRILTPLEIVQSIKLMVEIGIEYEVELLELEKEKESNSQKLKSLLKEIAKTQRYYISKHLAGLVIGAKGVYINRLKDKYKVNITINSNISGDKALIIITGDDEIAVEKCLNEVKFVEYSCEISPESEKEIRQFFQENSNKYRASFNIDKLNFSKIGSYSLRLIGLEHEINNIIKDLSQYLN